ncbi:hypothetical protein AB0E69_00335 [Kribbella sp. NPDC026611]|uniref:hypothetical protein n=1 Tax=Kribbella sp. NPDC026611 TaxID=3154911 RepID=UPI0033CB965F
MKRFVVTLLVCAAVCAGVGLLVSGEDYFDWGVAGGLFALAVVGESARTWLRRGRPGIRRARTPKDSRRESSGI